MAIISEMQIKVFVVCHSRVDPWPYPLLSVIVTLPLWLAMHSSQWPLKVACPETAFVLFVCKEALHHSRTILFTSRYIKKLLYFKCSLFYFFIYNYFVPAFITCIGVICDKRTH